MILAAALASTYALPSQRATACVHTGLPPVYFLLTSTPDRAARLPRVLSMLRRQTLPPRAAILTIAEHYDGARFANDTYPLGALEAVDADTTARGDSCCRLVVNRLPSDRGPISKYFGAVAPAVREPSTAIVVVGDDDMEYGSTFIEDYACAVHGGAVGTVFSSGIDVDCRRLGGCVMGFRGVAMRASMLAALPHTPLPRECFLADDVAITHYLARAPNTFHVRRLKLRSKYTFDEAFAWSNSSINSYHRERKFKVNKGCIAALLGPGLAAGGAKFMAGSRRAES